MIGFFGKIPAHGDFVSRGLNSQFVSRWDDWLQKVIPESRAILGGRWLDTYLVSPVWRFVVSKGIISEDCWSGLVVPSVDSVGRYFPLTVAFPITVNVSPCKFLAENDEYFRRLESECRDVLENTLNADCLLDNLAQIDFGQKNIESLKAGMLSDSSESLEHFAQGNTHSISPQFFALMDKLLHDKYSNYSLWANTNGTLNHMFAATGFPSGREFMKMLEATSF